MHNKFIQTNKNLNYSGIQELINFETGLKNYNSHIAKLNVDSMNLQEIRDRKERVMDFGAGIGTIAEILRDKYQLIVDCVEVDLGLIDLLRRKKFKTFSGIEKLNSKYRYIYASNVLEHIEDDSGVLKKLFSVIEVNGKLLVYVPAHPILFSNFDYTVGHFRRYRRSNLVQIVKNAGFSIEKCVYVDSLGFFVALIFKFKSKIFKNSDISERNLSFYDNLIYPISKKLDALGLKLIIGKNILLIAKKLDD
jgi:2-polyprenyl-3-methyl-5-hydroxy-6-metoxy-1,4-benzoquinol methylase